MGNFGWDELNDIATKLYQQGEFPKAIRAGKDTLKIVGVRLVLSMRIWTQSRTIWH